MNMKKPPVISTFLFLVLLFSTKTLAQQLPKVAPPSPEAASVFKFTEIPVSLYTGLPNINIPLFEIESGGVTIPISISYHARGIQVAEISSRVGMGWTLNAGGIISKQSRDVNDDMSSACNYTNVFTDEGKRLWIETNKELHSMDLCDMIPDQYSFSVNGMSGKFMQDRMGSGWVTQKYSNIKVSPNLIIDGNGNKYSFGENSVRDADKTMYKRTILQTGNYVHLGPSELSLEESTLLANTWHLTKIETAKGTVIEFKYKKEEIEYYRRLGDKYNSQSYSNESNISRIYSEQQRIDKIIFDKGEVIFEYFENSREDLPGSHSLYKIILKDKSGQIIRQAIFEYEYTTSTDTGNMNWYLASPLSTGSMFTSGYKRLFLQSVKIADKNNVTLPPYRFEYNPIVLPNRHSNSVDTWGYYNGKNNGSFLEQGLSDRTVDTLKVQAGMLTSIIKPEGGRTVFHYESNIAVNVFPATVWFENPNPSKPKHAFLALLDANPNNPRIDKETGLPCYKGSGIFEEVFEITEMQTGNITYTSSGTGVMGCSCYGLYLYGCTENPNYTCMFSRSIQKWNADTNTYNHYISLINGTQNITLPSGIYRLRVAYTGELPFPYDDAQNLDFAVDIHWKEELFGFGAAELTCENDELLTGTQKIVYAAGNRIKKIEYKDTDDSTELVKTYSYTIPNTEYVSGCVLGLTSIAEVSHFNMNGQPAVAYNQAVSIASLFNTYQNNAVGYKYVTEYYGDGDNNIGKTEYEYTMIYDKGRYYDFPQHPPTDNEWLRGKELKVAHYKKSGNNYQLVKKTENTYLLADDLEYTGIEGLCNHPFLRPSDIRLMTQNFLPNEEVYKRNKRYYTIPLAMIPIAPDPDDESNSYRYKTYYMTGGTFDLRKTKVTDYFDGGNEVVTETEYTYNYDEHYNPSSVKQTTSDGTTVKTEYQYPMELLSMPHTQDMVDKNMVDIPLVTKNHRGTSKLSEITTEYECWANCNDNDPQKRLLAPKVVKTSKGTNTLESRIQYIKYDDKGNPLELKQENGIHIVYLWGYNKSYPIAKIENATYLQVTGVLGTTNISEANLTAINNLRTNSAFANAMITTYTYKPLVGVTSITDPRGNKTTYHYDDFERLKFIKDHNDNIIQETKYNYQN